MKAFTIDVPDPVLDDLRARLARTRFPDQLEGTAWEYGTELGYLRDLCTYWREGFDWRSQESRLNRIPQFRSQVGDLGLHFLHARSPEADALPLLISHGWPGTVFEFIKIVGPLSDPVSHGGDARDAFHVICPSLPGYGFSDAPRRPGFDVRGIAETFAALMDDLGYTRYGVQGGDWGAFVSTWLADFSPEKVCGLHLNMVVAGPPPGLEDPNEGLSMGELAALADMAKFAAQETGYQQIQGTKPQTLGYALNDSPAGLAAWLVEKLRSWTDCNGDVDAYLGRDEILTQIMLYWVTGSITSSMRLYCENNRSRRYAPAERIEVPTAGAIFPRELMRPPRRWAEARYNIVRWTEMPRGGHFAAMEQPELLVEDIRAFFRELR
ncbi:MAG: epoxide hydrolase family protein [Myxococcota bacterium]